MDSPATSSPVRSLHATAQAKYCEKNKDAEKEKAKLRMRKLREERKHCSREEDRNSEGETYAEFMARECQELRATLEFQEFREFCNKVKVVRLDIDFQDPGEERFPEWKAELADYRDLVEEKTGEELDRLQCEARAKLRYRNAHKSDLLTKLLQKMNVMAGGNGFQCPGSLADWGGQDDVKDRSISAPAIAIPATTGTPASHIRIVGNGGASRPPRWLFLVIVVRPIIPAQFDTHTSNCAGLDPQPGRQVLVGEEGGHLDEKEKENSLASRITDSITWASRQAAFRRRPMAHAQAKERNKSYGLKIDMEIYPDARLGEKCRPKTGGTGQRGQDEGGDRVSMLKGFFDVPLFPAELWKTKKGPPQATSSFIMIVKNLGNGLRPTNMHAGEMIPDTFNPDHNPAFWCVPPPRDKPSEKCGGGYPMYLVTQGRKVGIWWNWTVAKTMVDGYPDSTFRGHHTVEGCTREWQLHCALGVHPHPVDPSLGNTAPGTVTPARGTGRPVDDELQGKLCSCQNPLLGFVGGKIVYSDRQEAEAVFMWAEREGSKPRILSTPDYAEAQAFSEGIYWIED
ncbi:hypothetical protein B0H13DRAFT_1901523 [Mycena leptocephala]|nr:hypothetical protein B0H13DRAFT_1901523 [Mycena leptocephala]